MVLSPVSNKARASSTFSSERCSLVFEFMIVVAAVALVGSEDESAALADAAAADIIEVMADICDLAAGGDDTRSCCRTIGIELELAVVAEELVTPGGLVVVRLGGHMMASVIDDDGDDGVVEGTRRASNNEIQLRTPEANAL